MSPLPRSRPLPIALLAFVFVSCLGYYAMGSRSTFDPHMTFVGDILPQIVIWTTLVLLFRGYGSRSGAGRLATLLVGGFGLLLSTAGILSIYASFHLPYFRGPAFAWW